MLSITNKGFVSLTSSEGEMIFKHVLNTAQSQCLILKKSDARSIEKLADRESSNCESLDLLEGDEKSFKGVAKQILLEILSEFLNCPSHEIASQENFMNLGLDSIQGLSLVQKLEEKTQHEFSASLFFEYSSVDELSEYLSSEYPSVFMRNGGETRLQKLTQAQMGLYINHFLPNSKSAYAYLRIKISGDFCKETFKASIKKLFQGNAILRSLILPHSESNAKPIFKITPYSEDGLQSVLLEENIQGEDIQIFEDSIVGKKFDLIKNLPFRAYLVGTDRGEINYICLHFHHIVCDAWSLKCIVEELFSDYGDNSGRETSQKQNFNHAKFLEDIFFKQNKKRDITWWNYYSKQNKVRNPKLPALIENQKGGIYHHGVYHQLLSRELCKKLNSLNRVSGYSKFIILLSLYFYTLMKLLKTDKLQIHIAHNGRFPKVPGINKALGSFARTVPFIGTLDGNHSFTSCLASIFQHWESCKSHLSISAGDLAKIDINKESSLGIGFSFFPMKAKVPSKLPFDIQDAVSRTCSDNTDISLGAWYLSDQLSLDWNYSREFFHDSTIMHFASYLESTLMGIDTAHFNTTMEPFRAQNFSFIHQIDHELKKSTKKPAIVDNFEELSYSDLARHTGCLLAGLKENDVQKGDIVAVLTDSGVGGIVAMLGVFYRGAVWLAIDPIQPEARIKQLLSEVDVRFILYQEKYKNLIQTLGDAFSSAEIKNLLKSKYHDELLPCCNLFDLACIFFTSGSTGAPKAVPVSHYGITNYLNWVIKQCGYVSEDIVAQTSPLYFDASLRQILAPLMVGGCVAPINQNIVAEPGDFIEYLQKRRISIWTTVPSHWARVVAYLEMPDESQEKINLNMLRWIKCGAEKLPTSLVKRWIALFGSRHRISNHYGPTESTINATYYECNLGNPILSNSIPIGRPIQGTTIKVVDDQMQEVEDGCIGEILIGGKGVSSGYLNASEKEQSRFISYEGNLCFKSGDLACKRQDGHLEFIERKDNQLKINGVRIEPFEIENVINSFNGVSQSAVVAIEKKNDISKKLVAYIEPHLKVELFEPHLLFKFLTEKLPSSLIPGKIVCVLKLPTNQNGKIDRKQLIHNPPKKMRLARKETAKGFSPEKSPIIVGITKIWETVLNVEQPIKPSDDFFCLGGDSMTALVMFNKLQNLNINIPPYTSLYQYRTLEEFVQHLNTIQDDVRTPASSPTHHDTHACFPITPAQAGFLLFRKIAPDSPDNWLSLFQVKGPFDQNAFKQAIEEVIRRHEMLRTVFPTEKMGFQKELPISQAPPIDLFDLTEHSSKKQDEFIDSCHEKVLNTNFDLSKWPLFHIHVYFLSSQATKILIAMNHIICDGFSAFILLREINQLYLAITQQNEPKLSSIKYKFKDYVAYLSRKNSSNTEIKFWTSCFKKPYQQPVLPIINSSSGNSHRSETLEIAPSTIKLLKSFCIETEITLFEYFLALFSMELMNLTNSRDLVIGTAINGREYPLPNILDMVGCFATAIPVRFSYSNREESKQLKHRVKQYREAKKHFISTKEIAALLPPGTPKDVAIGSQFFFSFMDFSKLSNNEGEELPIAWDVGTSQMQLPTSVTDLCCSVRVLKGVLCFNLVASCKNFNQFLLRKITSSIENQINVTCNGKVQVEHQPNNPESTKSELIDSVLIAYYPPSTDMKKYFSIDKYETPQQLSKFQTIKTKHGNATTLLLPFTADQLPSLPTNTLISTIEEAIDTSKTMGARAVSFAGMLPAHTQYAHSVKKHIAKLSGMKITTGHSCTVVSVVMNTVRLLKLSGLRIQDLTVSCVGMGSIGSASIELLFHLGMLPKRLILCDRSGNIQHIWRLLTKHADMLQHIDVRVTESQPNKNLPSIIYESDLIVGAASSSNILSIDKLKSGTMIVDDSFPHIFNTQHALNRIFNQKDVIIIGGGLLNAGTMNREIHDIFGGENYTNILAKRWPLIGLPSCLLEGLLLAKDLSLPETIGLVEKKSVNTYWERCHQLSIKAAPLHLTNEVFSPELLKNLNADF